MHASSDAFYSKKLLFYYIIKNSCMDLKDIFIYRLLIPSFLTILYHKKYIKKVGLMRCNASVNR